MILPHFDFFIFFISFHFSSFLPFTIIFSFISFPFLFYSSLLFTSLLLFSSISQSIYYSIYYNSSYLSSLSEINRIIPCADHTANIFLSYLHPFFTYFSYSSSFYIYSPFLLIFSLYSFTFYFPLKMVDVPKLQDAHWAGTNKSSKCTLVLTEGDSAMALAVAGFEVVGREV